MFKLKSKIRKGFTLVELIVVMVIISVLGVIVFSKIGNSTDEAKVTAIAQTIESYNRSINIYNTREKDYLDMKSKISSFDDGDQDILDEMVEYGLIGKFPKEKFNSPNDLVIEIREAKIDGYKRFIYLYVDTTDSIDKEYINKALESLHPKDEDVAYVN